MSERISGGGGWAREHWWCALVLVCKRWRHIIFGSPSYLRLCIVYTSGTPVAEMLAHPLFYQIPLAIEYIHKGPDKFISPEDKQEIILMLKHRSRVRRIRLHAPYSGTLFRALDGEFPILECLYLKIPNARPVNWEPPRTFRTPCLQQLVLDNIICPLQPLLFAPAVGIVTLSLTEIYEVDKFSPNNILQQLSLMPRLETLRIGFDLFTGIPARQTQMMRTRVKLPFLRRFLFNGTSTYLGLLLPHISTPPLEKLQIYISNRKTNTIPYILQLMSGSENFTCHSANVMFLDKGVFLRANLSDGTKWTALSMSFHGNELTWQVLSVAQFLDIHRTCFNTTKYLTIHCRIPGSLPVGPQVGPEHVPWRRLYGLLCNVNALLVYDGPHGEISRSFQINPRESAIKLFPRLKQLSIHTSSGYRDECAPFINARRNIGYPVHLVRIGKGPTATQVAMDCEAWEAPWLWGSFRLRLG